MYTLFMEVPADDFDLYTHDLDLFGYAWRQIETFETWSIVEVNTETALNNDIAFILLWD